MLGCGSGTGQGDVLEFRLLGPLEVLEGDRVLPLGGEKQRAALAMLLLHRNMVVSRDRLIGGISSPPAPQPDRGLSSITVAPPVVSPPSGRAASGDGRRRRWPPRGWTAAIGGAALASRDWPAGGEDLREALSLFKGAPLEDLAHVPFAQAEVGRLEELRLGALGLRLDADLEIGRHLEVVGELESLVARFPFRERFWALLMLALYRSGRQGDALLAFDRARRILGEELGVDPGPPLQQLHQRILQAGPLPGARQGPGSGRAVDRRPFFAPGPAAR